MCLLYVDGSFLQLQSNINKNLKNKTIFNCDWLLENPPLMHKDEYLEIRKSIIQNVYLEKA